MNKLINTSLFLLNEYESNQINITFCDDNIIINFILDKILDIKFEIDNEYLKFFIDNIKNFKINYLKITAYNSGENLELLNSINANEIETIKPINDINFLIQNKNIIKIHLAVCSDAQIYQILNNSNLIEININIYHYAIPKFEEFIKFIKCLHKAKVHKLVIKYIEFERMFSIENIINKYLKYNYILKYFELRIIFESKISRDNAFLNIINNEIKKITNRNILIPYNNYINFKDSDILFNFITDENF
jgi:hypothetical protein